MVLSQSMTTLYITEESAAGCSRADRMNLPKDKLKILNETEVSSILNHAQKVKPSVIVDSIQTANISELNTAVGISSKCKRL